MAIYSYYSTFLAIIKNQLWIRVIAKNYFKWCLKEIAVFKLKKLSIIKQIYIGQKLISNQAFFILDKYLFFTEQNSISYQTFNSHPLVNPLRILLVTLGISKL